MFLDNVAVFTVFQTPAVAAAVLLQQGLVLTLALMSKCLDLFKQYFGHL